jgi:choline dehydrogenase
MLPHFKSMEDYHGAADEFHSKGGPWRVDKQRLQWPILELFAKAVQEAGIPRNDDFNRGDNFGVGYFDVSQRDGWRLTAYQAFIAPLQKERKNLTTMAHAHVTSLAFANHVASSSVDAASTSSTSTVPQVTGIICRRPGKNSNDLIKIEAKREVILSSGAIGSVEILERSGIGNADLLRKYAIIFHHVYFLCFIVQSLTLIHYYS